jgi:mono/diheme cytochrome c family protein
MLRQFKYIVCAAVVGFASHGGAVAPACEPCGACHGGHANITSAPPRNIRIRWVAVYEGDRVRLVPRVYRAQISAPATLLSAASTSPATGGPAPTTPAVEASASGNLPNSGPAPAGAATSGAVSSESVSADRPALANRAQALLRARCVRCHGEQRQESGLDLRSRETILKGGASGPGLIPGKPDESLVLNRVCAGEMPPTNGGRLSAEEVATLQQWIAAGAPSERAGQR